MHRPKKIIHLITGFGLGGAETMLFRLLTTWANDPVHNHIVVILRDNLAFDLDSIGINYKIFDLKASKSKIPTLLCLYRYILLQKPDLIHAWMYHACFISSICFMLRIPVIWGVHHSLHDLKNESQSLRIIIWISSFIAKLNFVRKVIYVSNISRVHHENIGYPRLKSAVIPNGFDCEYFSPQKTLRDKIRISLDLSSDLFLIGSFGRFHSIKNHRILLSALSYLNDQGFDFCILLAGEGMDKSNLVLCSWIKEFGLNSKVRLLGARRDMSALYNALDLYALSSNSESFPNVLGEAMSCGIPCVSTDVGDSSLILDNAGWIVPVKDSEKLALAIIDMYMMPASDRAKLSERARHLIMSRYNLLGISTCYNDLYAASINTSKSTL